MSNDNASLMNGSSLSENTAKDQSNEQISLRSHFDLLLISAAILFLELACIRWFGSMVIYLTFFTNLVLLGCFLGMSIGCMIASKKTNYINYVIPITLVSITLSAVSLLMHSRLSEYVRIDLGNQRSPQEVFFGTTAPDGGLSRLLIPMELIACVFFMLIAVIFIGLGQEMGRKFNAIPNRVGAYTANILGSLTGILIFGAASYFQTTPLVWFGIAMGICFLYLPQRTTFQSVCLIVLLLVAGGLSYFTGLREQKWSKIIWSPYYKVTYNPITGVVDTNNIGHQTLNKYDGNSPGYALPYLLSRDADHRSFDNVLVIGAGSGNDVQAALANDATHVDAVEIDPVLFEIGRDNHPDHPYFDHRVVRHLDDGRSFIRKTQQKYDLITYALVDSLVLHSGYSSLRLESFLFTEEAFQDIKRRLQPNGVFATYNFYRQGWVVGRLVQMIKKVFGTDPIVISLPYQSEITKDSQEGRLTFLLVGNADCTTINAIRKQFEERFFYWLNKNPVYNKSINGFGSKPPDISGTKADDWLKIGLADVQTDGIDRLPTDNWPFLYLREAAIPGLNLRGMLLIGMLSVGLLLLFAPACARRVNGQMFFLGAGFMLLETKGVVHMALLFGSTWIVNSIVFFAILVMILTSNLFVIIIQPRRLWPYYVLLIATLLVNAYTPMSFFLSLQSETKIMVSCMVVFIPVALAGIIFSTAFRDSSYPDFDFGSNVGGVIIGGLSEYLSLVLGFEHLLFVAIAFYLLSAMLAPKQRPQLPSIGAF